MGRAAAGTKSWERVVRGDRANEDDDVGVGDAIHRSARLHRSSTIYADASEYWRFLASRLLTEIRSCHPDIKIVQTSDVDGFCGRSQLVSAPISANISSSCSSGCREILGGGSVVVLEVRANVDERGRRQIPSHDSRWTRLVRRGYVSARRSCPRDRHDMRAYKSRR